MLSIPGLGDVTAPRVYSYFGEPEKFPTSRKAQGFVGFYPEVKESGASRRKGLALSKKGPGQLRRDLFLITEHFRRLDPDGARVYYDQMVHKGKHHNSALCVVANRLVIPRIQAVIKERRPYELRDFEGNPITKERARELVAQYRVPEEVRQRLRGRKRPSAETNRGSGRPQVTSEPVAPRSGTAQRRQELNNERLSLTRDQLALLVFRSVERLLNKRGDPEEIQLLFQMEMEDFFEERT